MAIVWRERHFTFDWLRQEIVFWSRQWAGPGTRPGVVALSADYSPRAVAMLLALLRAGCIVSLTTRLPARRKTDLLRLAEVDTEIEVDHEDRVTVRHVGHRITHPLLASLASDGVGGLVLFTSGSSGEVKAVVHRSDRLLGAYRKPGRARVTIPFMLFDHIGGLNTLLQVLASGGTVVVAPDRDPMTICALVARHRVQVLPTTPTFLNLLLLSDYRAHDLSSLDTVAYGAERMPAALLGRLADALPGVRLVQNYGLSEAGIVRTRPAADGSLWMAIGDDGCETRVRDGLLEIRTSSMMVGYLNHPSPFTEDGWLMTGDRVEVRAGFLRILGRASDIINIGGEKVYPAELEDLIATMPDVIEVVVSAESNAITGQIARVDVRLSSTETRAEFRARMTAFLQGTVADFKIPQRVVLSHQPLHNARGKRRRC